MTHFGQRDEKVIVCAEIIRSSVCMTFCYRNNKSFIHCLNFTYWQVRQICQIFRSNEASGTDQVRSLLGQDCTVCFRTSYISGFWKPPLSRPAFISFIQLSRLRVKSHARGCWDLNWWLDVITTLTSYPLTYHWQLQ